MKRWGALILEIPAEHEETILGLLGAGILVSRPRYATDFSDGEWSLVVASRDP